MNIFELPAEELEFRNKPGYRIVNVFKKAEDVILLVYQQPDGWYDYLLPYTNGENYSLGPAWDIIRKKKNLKGFINVYPGGDCVFYTTRVGADHKAAPDRIACIELSQFEEGYGLDESD